mmetsp:Transcript_21123/g.59433  ORF Transcript_21123/g.59433 Transcript_21123/m.59433 type:complete len:258 (-) Transcript_21123:1647-2420(-)
MECLCAKQELRVSLERRVHAALKRRKFAQNRRNHQGWVHFARISRLHVRMTIVQHNRDTQHGRVHRVRKVPARCIVCRKLIAVIDFALRHIRQFLVSADFLVAVLTVCLRSLWFDHLRLVLIAIIRPLLRSTVSCRRSPGAFALLRVRRRLFVLLVLLLGIVLLHLGLLARLLLLLGRLRPFTLLHFHVALSAALLLCWHTDRDALHGGRRGSVLIGGRRTVVVLGTILLRSGGHRTLLRLLGCLLVLLVSILRDLR